MLVELTLMTPDGVPLPMVKCSVVPGQIDDLLMAGPVLDQLGFQRYDEHFELACSSVKVPRDYVFVPEEETPPTQRAVPVLEGLPCVTCRRVVVPPHQEAMVEVRVRGEMKYPAWFEPDLASAPGYLLIPEGPADAGLQHVIVRNTSEEAVVIEESGPVGVLRTASDEESGLSEAFLYDQVLEDARRERCAPSPHEAVEEPGRSNAHVPLPLRDGAQEPRIEPKRGRSSPSILKRWLLLVMTVMSMSPWPQLPDPSLFARATGVEPAVIPQGNQSADVEYRWPVGSFETAEYRAAVETELRGQRASTYAHLTNRQFDRLVALAVEHSAELALEDSQPTTFEGYLFDIELHPNSQPVRAQLARMSPEESKKVAYHVAKYEKSSQLRIPTDEQKSSWATRVLIVQKKDDPNGRLICDFRALNRSTLKRPTPLGDVPSKVRQLATRFWKSALDALSGFNQMQATERAARLMQIITAVGLRQFVVLPFGVTNGPPYFQEAMLDLYNGSSRQLPCLLGESMVEHDAALEIFVDDVTLGSGDGSALASCELGSKALDASFDHHLAALRKVLERARAARLRFKLAKCAFAQLELPVLGMEVGINCVRASPTKVQGITAWPRPSRLEDLEKFLATTVFIRDHLSPRYSNVTRPLREALKELQERRRSGKKQPKGKYCPLGAPAPDDDWPSWWTQECENAFLAVKDMVRGAMELAAPDYEGGASGRNKYHLYPDACNYGIGSALFQAPKASDNDTLYTQLGVPTWATKLDMDRRIAQVRRDAKLRSVGLGAAESAYETLRDSQEREKYDQQIGLEERRRARVDLRVLGCHSCSLDATQRAWPVWERELLAVLRGLQHFRTIVAGATVVVHTDHINNTTIREELASPEKILRMMNKIAGIAEVEWVYTPGKVQVGDGFSRNPQDRNASRLAAEGHEGVPRNLDEMFRHLGSITTGLKADEGSTSRTRHSTVEDEAELVVPPELPGLLQGWPRGQVIVQAPTNEAEQISCLVFPTHVADEEHLKRYDQLSFISKHVRLKGSIVVPPQYIGDDLSQRWLPPFVEPPRNKTTRKECRHALLDGVLRVLRSARDAEMRSFIGHGEGGIVVAASLSAELRLAAYTERRVPEVESLELESVAQAFQYVLLLAPHAFPVRSFLGMLREYVPEIVSMIPPEGTRVHVVLPSKDATLAASLEVFGSILGASKETLEFPGPAYRTVLPKPTPLMHLFPREDVPSVAQVENELPRKCVEAFAGTAILTQTLAQAGFDVRAYEVRPPIGPHGEGVDVLESDLERAEVLAELEEELIKKCIYYLHISFPCSSWTPFQSLNGSTRTLELPQGDGTLPREVKGNLQASLSFRLLLLCIKHGVFFTLEHPSKSRFWKLPLTQYILALEGIFLHEVDECAWGKRPSDWNSTQGDIRTQRSICIVTNCPTLNGVRRRCYEVATHTHRAAWGTDESGAKRAKEAGAYPREMATALARGIRAAFLQKLTPTPQEQTVADLKVDASSVALSVEDLANIVPARPTSVGGATASGGSSRPEPAPPSAAASAAAAPARDYWVETETTWIRYHVTPRRRYFVPSDEPEGGPRAADLTKIRETHIVFVNGTTDSRRHDWTSSEWRVKSIGKQWKGRSVFFKLTPTPKAPEPPVPGEFAAPKLQPALAGLRGQLRTAQRQDPVLQAVIKRLGGQAAGTYLVDPRGKEAKRVSHMSQRFRLSSDGVLVASAEGDDSRPELPVVPLVPYANKIEGAPPNMTWKHFLLAAAHNDPTSLHRHHRDMVPFLSSLVSWNPPEDLARDCKRWYSLCKLCASVHGRPGVEGPMKSIRFARPFSRLQIDLMEVKPTGDGGERYLFTTICTSTKYLFLRACTNRDSSELARILLDVILDAGVVPSVVQSDNEFCNLSFEELTALLGSNQIFSTALRPQSQGIVERSHKDLRASLAIVVDTYIRARPRSWPKYLRLLEHKMRHKANEEGHTPYSAIHGFAGSSSLSTAMGAITEIPESVVWNDWLRLIISEAKEISAELEEVWRRNAEQRARRHGEQNRVDSFHPGRLVLVSKPFFERGQGIILPQCDGPYSILARPSAHTAILGEPLTGQVAFGSKPVSIARLVAFDFPLDCAFPAREEMTTDELLESLKRGDFVAVRFAARVHVAHVERIFRDQKQLELTVYEVPTDCRFGPWTNRRWEIKSANGQPVKDVFPSSEVLCRVFLSNGALTTESLEKLSAQGLSTGLVPTRDKAISATYG